jgi:hypothetical protein
MTLPLANLDLDAVRAKVLRAYDADDPVLQKFRGYARRLKDSVKPLRTYSVNAVSFVSMDGGDNRLVFNPAVVELVRVVDSRGREWAMDAVARTAKLSELEKRIQPGSAETVDPLQRLCADLKLTLSQLSYLLKGMDEPSKSTGAMRTYRDIVEWAVLYDLVANPKIQWGSDTIIVRDALLRTKSFRRDVFPQIDRRIRDAVERHAKDSHVRIAIVGVAKQSAVLSRLAVALELEATFAKPYPCFVQVPRDVEEDCYNFDRTWLDTYETTEDRDDGDRLYQSMGQMFLAKFGDMPMDPVWPVDIAVWQVSEAEKILGQLALDAQQGFPIPDYPMCIQRAHDFAKLTGIEVEVLQDILLGGVTQKLTPDEVERLLRLKYLGQHLAGLRYKEG